MLRYDSCFPVSEEMSARIESRDFRQIQLKRRAVNNKLAPSSIARWRAFRWTVIKEEEV
jgi:hypothetical protein